ncbi:amino acid ABC transporter permease [Halarcobacter ebronensis]|uniref:Amino acid ABC transporter permease n=1 Tax=Halarcobacter ebronensis TaxID=1462615 RepID=A0A4Q1APG2_9BACT|nr:amino acid ABC transporter permease [Halarcobacter ebronensis]QKF81026.1 amino acid ABC transporter, permease protein [Halarcobacter ebronensis]RXJ68929.1 amino acid ABC transporter permease [Halarcobacter ebronensis]RXK06337.1 amino acid ABC transporter permease [Halarcobacter ebronensis]
MAIYSKKESRPAPVNTKGFTYWVRENLFSSLSSTILTILSFALILYVVPPLLNYLIFDATWSGTKEQITGHGARWIYIYEKFNQFIYGFYPEDQYYRPNLIVGIFILYIVLFRKIRNIKFRIFIIVSFPLISLLLLHGGLGLEIIPTQKWGGLLLTIVVASVGILASFPIGIVFALGRQSNMPIIRTISVMYIEFIRGVPLITLLFMSSVILPLFFPEGMDFDKLLRALIGITLFQSAYIAEVIRGGLQAIPKGQYEAADSIGLSYWQTMGLIILPQALKISIPNIVGAFISLFKDTTLVLIIGLFDMLAMVTLTATDANWLGFETEGYVFVTLIYWIICFSMSKYAKSIENRFNTNHR